MHRVPAARFQMPFGSENFFGCGAGFLLVRFNFLAIGFGFTGGRLKERVLLGSFLGDSSQLNASGFQFRARGSDPGFQLADALGVAAAPRHVSLQLNGGLAGATLGLVAFTFELISAFGEGVLGGF
jgi:hypothetical protein